MGAVSEGGGRWQDTEGTHLVTVEIIELQQNNRRTHNRLPRKPLDPSERKRAPGGGRKPNPLPPDTTDVHTRVPNVDLAEIDRLVGKGGRSAFVREAIREKLDRRKGRGGEA